MRTSNDRWTSPDRSVAAWRSMNGGGDPLLEHALVLLEAQDLGAQPPELAAQGVDVGDVVLDLGGGAAQGGREPSGHGRDRRRDAAARRRRVTRSEEHTSELQ